jgi:hypothetical protein
LLLRKEHVVMAGATLQQLPVGADKKMTSVPGLRLLAPALGHHFLEFWIGLSRHRKLLEVKSHIQNDFMDGPACIRDQILSNSLR